MYLLRYNLNHNDKVKRCLNFFINKKTEGPVRQKKLRMIFPQPKKNK